MTEFERFKSFFAQQSIHTVDYLNMLKEEQWNAIPPDLAVSDLEKEFSFVGRRYTGMGILWAMFGHHAYHLGQLDLLMRQLNFIAPEYMEWSETEKVIC